MPAAQTLQRHTAIVKCLRMFRPARKRTVAPTIALQTAFASSSRPGPTQLCGVLQGVRSGAAPR
jgi:hypothetical protein